MASAATGSWTWLRRGRESGTASRARNLGPHLVRFAWLVCSLWVGCATGPLPVHPPVGGPPLESDEGLVVIHIDTDVPIEWISLGRRQVVAGLPKGKHVWLARLRAGRYEWDQIRIGSEAGREATIDLDEYRALQKREDWVWDEEYRFDVVAGVISYPGELIIRSEGALRSAGRGFSIRNRNHSAMAVRRLLKTHPDLLRAYAIRHTGAGEDGFLDFYSEIRSKVGDRSRESVDGRSEP